MGGIFGGSKKSSSASTTTTTTNDNRVVADGGSKVQGAGALDAAAGASITSVAGSGNNVTDGGAFAIVDKIASAWGDVARAQSETARAIALRGTPEGTEYARAAIAAQEAASSDSSGWGDTINPTKPAGIVALSAVAAAAVYLMRKG